MLILDMDKQEIAKEGIAGFLREKLRVITSIRKVQRISDYIYIVEINSWEENSNIGEKMKTKGSGRY